MNKPGAVRVYLTLAFFGALAMSMIWTYNIVNQATRVGLNELQLVLIGTTLEVAILLGEIPTGIVADVYSRRLSIIIGTFLIGIGFIIEGFSQTFWLIVLAQVVWGIGYTFTSGATTAWLTDEIGDSRVGAVLLRASQVRNLGAMAGILVGSFFASIATNMPIVIGGTLHALTAVYLLWGMEEHGFKPVPKEDRQTWHALFNTLREGIQLVRARPVIRLLLFTGLFYGMFSEAFDRLWQKHLLDNAVFPSLGGLSTLMWFGIISLLDQILSIGVTEVVIRKVDTTSARANTRFLMLVTAGMVVSLFTFANGVGFVMLLTARLVFGLLRGLIGPVYDAWMNQHLESKTRATVLSMAGQVDAIGQLSGGPALGVVGLRASTRAAITASAIILSPAVAIFWRALRLPDVPVAGPEIEPQPAGD